MNSKFRYMTMTEEQLGKIDAGQWCIAGYSKPLGIYWVARPEPDDRETVTETCPICGRRLTGWAFGPVVCPGGCLDEPEYDPTDRWEESIEDRIELELIGRPKPHAMSEEGY